MLESWGRSWHFQVVLPLVTAHVIISVIPQERGAGPRSGHTGHEEASSLRGTDELPGDRACV